MTETTKRPEPIKSKMVKAGKINYFFDVKEAKNGNKYLVITESSLQPDGKSRRNSIMVFDNRIEDFGQAVNEMMAEVKAK